jgi:hypothetical protein
VACLIVGTEYNCRPTLSEVPAMVMAQVKAMAINCDMFVNPFVMNSVKTAQIHIWLHEEISRIDPAQKVWDNPHVFISVVNESSLQLLSLLTLCIRLSERLFAHVQQWYSMEKPQLK